MVQPDLTSIELRHDVGDATVHERTLLLDGRVLWTIFYFSVLLLASCARPFRNFYRRVFLAALFRRSDPLPDRPSLVRDGGHLSSDPGPPVPGLRRRHMASLVARRDGGIHVSLWQ